MHSQSNKIWMGRAIKEFLCMLHPAYMKPLSKTLSPAPRPRLGRWWNLAVVPAPDALADQNGLKVRAVDLSLDNFAAEAEA